LSGRHLSIFAFAFAAVTAWSAEAVAAPVELEWIATAECPSASYVLGEVERSLGSAPGPQKSVRARADVAHDEQGPWRVTLVTQTEGTSGRRTFAAENCLALADATALILAMTVNSTMPAPPPEPEASPVAAPAQPPTPTAAEPRRQPEAATTTTTTSIRFSASASLAGDTGTLPSASVGPQLALAWLPGRFRGELAVAYGAPQRGSGAGDRGEGADFDVWTAGARAGYAWPIGAFHLGPLLGADLARIGAAGFGGTTSFKQSAVFVAVGAGLRVSWSPLPRFALRLVGQGIVPLSRPSFVIVEPAPTPAELVHRPAALAGRMTLGVEWQFF
jgi:hypothetical protein